MTIILTYALHSESLQAEDSKNSN